MRLVTRADFDGLVCAALLKENGLINSIKFVHPKDVQDGLVEVDENDVLANIPFMKGAGMWFDHHISEAVRLKEEEIDMNGVKGAVKRSPSAARVIWDYYGGHKTFPKSFDPMMEAVDKVDSADLTVEDIENPEGWVLLGFIVDPRTGLGRHTKFAIGNWELMEKLVDFCRTMTIDEILKQPDIKERIQHYWEQSEHFKKMIKETAVAHDNVLVMDLRRIPEIRAGNRFLVYTLFPDCNVSIQMMWDHKKENVVITVGHSITNRSCKANIGTLLLEYGGGGHAKVGTCQIYAPMAEETLKQIIERLKKEC